MISRNIQLLKKESSKVKYITRPQTVKYLLERTARVQLLSQCIKLRPRIATENSFRNSRIIIVFKSFFYWYRNRFKVLRSL